MRLRASHWDAADFAILFFADFFFCFAMGFRGASTTTATRSDEARVGLLVPPRRMKRWSRPP